MLPGERVSKTASFDSFQGDPEFRSWLERIVEDKVREVLALEKERHFRESLALISVRPDCPLALAISKFLGESLVPVDIIRFGDGEKKTVVKENLRGKHVYVIATVGDGEDPDVSLANTLKVVSTLRRSCKVNQINVVAPCLWYQAQDKTHARRESVSVRDVADDLLRRGMNHIIVTSLHAEQIEIAFESFDHLKMEPIYGHYLTETLGPDTNGFVLISPDDGGVRMREELLKNLDPSLIAGQAAVHQLRVRGSVDEKRILDFVGRVDNTVGVVVDDMLRSGTTMFQAARAAKEKGARRVIGVVTHFFGFDSPSQGKFEMRLAASALDELVCTNTRPDILHRLQKSEVFRERVTVLDISPYLSQAIRNYETGGTVKDMLYRVDRGELYRIAHRARTVGKESSGNN